MPYYNKGNSGPSVPVDEVKRRENVRSELKHWVALIRRNHENRKDTSSGIDSFKRKVPDIWIDMKALARGCSSDAVVHENRIRFSDKEKLAEFLGDDLKRRDGEKHVVIVNKAKPFTIDYDGVILFTIEHYYEYDYDSTDGHAARCK